MQRFLMKKTIRHGKNFNELDCFRGSFELMSVRIANKANEGDRLCVR